MPEQMGTPLVVEAFLVAKRGAGRRDATLDEMAKYGRQFALYCPLYPPTPVQIDLYLGASTTDTVRFKRWANLRAVCRFAEMRYGYEDPSKRLDPPRKPEVETVYLSRAEMTRMWNACRDIRDRAIVLVLFGSAVRPGEAVRLQFRHVGPDVMHIPGGKRGKRIVPTPPGFYALVQRQAQLRDATAEDYIIWNLRTGKNITSLTLGNVYREIALRARIPFEKRRPYYSRHTSLSWYYRDTKDPLKVQALAGHRNLSMTQRYVHVDAYDLAEDFAKESAVAGLTGQMSFDELAMKRSPREELPAPPRERRQREATRLFDLRPGISSRVWARILLCDHTTVLDLQHGRIGVSRRMKAAIRRAFPEYTDDQLFYTAEIQEEALTA